MRGGAEITASPLIGKDMINVPILLYSYISSKSSRYIVEPVDPEK